MKFFDTGVALKLIISEPLSPVVRDFVEKHKTVIPFSRLMEIEMENTLQAHFFRKAISGQELAGAKALLAEMVRAGLFRRISLSLDKIASEALMLAPLVSARTGCRTPDLMHVATAKLHGASEFVSTDKRQIEAAKFCGLRTINLEKRRG